MSISTEAGRTHFIKCNKLEPRINDDQLTPDGFLYVKRHVIIPNNYALVVCSSPELGSYRSNVRNWVCIRAEDIVSLVLFYLFFALIRISNSQQCMVTGANKGGEGWCRLATLF